MNLLCGVLGVIFTLEGRIDIAFPLMLAAAVADFSDGLAARLLGAYSPMGKELDSLADMVSFGVLPSVMLCEAMGTDGWTRFIPVFLAVMSGLRLAKFNVDERQETDFMGLATPSSAMIAGSLAYLAPKVPQIGAFAHSSWGIPVLAVALGLLLVSEIPMFGMKVKKGHSLLDAKRITFLCLAALSLLAPALLGVNWSLAILLAFCFYVTENLILFLIKK